MIGLNVSALTLTTIQSTSVPNTPAVINMSLGIQIASVFVKRSVRKVRCKMLTRVSVREETINYEKICGEKVWDWKSCNSRHFKFICKV